MLHCLQTPGIPGVRLRAQFPGMARRYKKIGSIPPSTADGIFECSSPVKERDAIFPADFC